MQHNTNNYIRDYGKEGDIAGVTKPTRITKETLPGIIDNIKDACDAEKDYQILITLFDNSLKARQRALAQCWYKDVADSEGYTPAYAEALCKYHYGFRIRCENDPDLEHIIRSMLDGRMYEDKIKIIQKYPEFFPILRNDGGMTAEQQGRYLFEIQRGMGAHGIYLTTPKERALLSYPEAG